MSAAPGELQLAMGHLQAGRWEEGIALLKTTLAREPGFAEVWSNLGYALRVVGRTTEAREALERAVALKPELPDAWNLLGLVEQEAHRHAEALGRFERALALRPDFGVAWMNRANSEQALGRVDAALASYARALELAPAHAGIHYNLGYLHHKVTGRLDGARRHYEEAIRLDPAFANAHLNLGQVSMLEGDLGAGWREFAWREPRLGYVPRSGTRYEMPRTEPWPARLAIRSEQGLGDILFFLRYAGLARERGSALSFEGDARLYPILARTGLFSRLGEGDAGAAEILVGDLPLLFPSAIPPALRLEPEPAVRERLAQRFRIWGPRPWILLTWRAGERGSGLFERLYKEIPVEALGAALRGKATTWISVQRQPAEGECEALARSLGAAVHDASDVNADLEAALAAMDLADDYIGVSNTNVHLRAGVGKGARVLVPFAPEWRWGLEGESRWFRGMRTYRQAPGGDWSRALADLARDLA